MERYNTLQQIGKGTFGTAFLVETKDDKKRYVLKKIRLARQTDKQREATLREMKLLSSLEHNHIVTYKESWIEKGCIVCIVTQYCDGGDLLLQLQKSNGKPFSEDQILSWFVQTALALSYIHEAKVLHRDVKSSNIFLTKSGILQLGDFGLARMLEGTMEMAQTLVGTPNYMCPELLQDKPYDYKSDVWSMGCVMYELTALKPAFQAFNMSGLMNKICKGALAPMPSQYSQEWRTMVRCMLSKDPSERPTCDEMLQAPFLQPHIERVKEKVAKVGGFDTIRFPPPDISVSTLKDIGKGPQDPLVPSVARKGGRATPNPSRPAPAAAAAPARPPRLEPDRPWRDRPAGGGGGGKENGGGGGGGGGKPPAPPRQPAAANGGGAGAAAAAAAGGAGGGWEPEIPPPPPKASTNHLAGQRAPAPGAAGGLRGPAFPEAPHKKRDPQAEFQEKFRLYLGEGASKVKPGGLKGGANNPYR